MTRQESGRERHRSTGHSMRWPQRRHHRANCQTRIVEYPRHAIAGWVRAPARHPPQRHHLRRVPGMAHILWRQHHVGRVHRPRRQNWASGGTPFSALSEPPAPAGDNGGVGVRLAIGVTLPGSGTIGQTRLGSSTPTIAVDPRNHRTVYVGWSDIVGATSTPTVHVRRSVDRGQTWGADVRTIGNAINPGLAINSRGRVCFMYQQLTGTAPTQRWETHIELTDNDWAAANNRILSNTPAAAPAPPLRPVSRRLRSDLLAVGQGLLRHLLREQHTEHARTSRRACAYQRGNVNFADPARCSRLTASRPVAVSIDPFFFRSDRAGRRTRTSTSATGPTASRVGTRGWSRRPIPCSTGRATCGIGSPTPLASSMRTINPRASWLGTDREYFGDNWAFARVHRKAVGPAATVMLRFLVSPFGTGSNYQLAGTGADPTLAFGATDLALTLSERTRLAARRADDDPRLPGS